MKLRKSRIVRDLEGLYEECFRIILFDSSFSVDRIFDHWIRKKIFIQVTHRNNWEWCYSFFIFDKCLDIFLG